MNTDEMNREHAKAHWPRLILKVDRTPGSVSVYAHSWETGNSELVNVTEEWVNEHKPRHGDSLLEHPDGTIEFFSAFGVLPSLPIEQIRMVVEADFGKASNDQERKRQEDLVNLIVKAGEPRV